MGTDKVLGSIAEDATVVGCFIADYPNCVCLAEPAQNLQKTTLTASLAGKSQ